MSLIFSIEEKHVTIRFIKKGAGDLRIDLPKHRGGPPGGRQVRAGLQRRVAGREERLPQSPTGAGRLVRGPIQTGRVKINLVSGEPRATLKPLLALAESTTMTQIEQTPGLVNTSTGGYDEEN
jgi:hypothetical protein